MFKRLIHRASVGLALLVSGLLTVPMALAAADPAIDRVAAYLNDITTLKARFIQVGPEGDLAEGMVYLERPHKVRFEYSSPAGLLLVSDGDRLQMWDPEIAELSEWPVTQTPAGMLLKERIDLGGEIEVLEVARESGFLRLTVAERADRGAGTLTVVFSEAPFELKQWWVKDAQGLTTRVTLLESQYGIALDPALFDFQARGLSPPGEAR